MAGPASILVTSTKAGKGKEWKGRGGEGTGGEKRGEEGKKGKGKQMLTHQSTGGRNYKHLEPLGLQEMEK